MRAAVLKAIGEPLQLTDLTVDEPTGKEVRVRVRASGLCHSDLTVSTNDLGFPLPMVMGHEVAGVIDAVGDAVDGFAVGDRIAVCSETWCGECANCRRGQTFRCSNPMAIRRSPDQPSRLTDGTERVQAFLGVGGFAEQVIVHQNNLIPIPDDLPFDRAALLGCGVATGAGAALNSADVRRGDSVAVMGCGGVGLNTIQGAAIAGAQRVIAIDLADDKLELARRFGATDVINAAEVDPVAAVSEITGGVGVTYTFEVTGTKNAAITCMDMLAVGGTTFIIGVQKPGTVFELPFTYFFDQKAMRGVAMGSTNPKVDLPRYADLYLQGRFNLDDLVGRTISLDDVNDAYADLQRGSVARSVIVFDD
ncbi:Zn-dependent alcohol dehydrogenase [Microbacterium sp.]|uniref:Zn-dependent alcohol dehydrogenase n=1 Tax=Microbacterium sp. TaxID=51671 RepID=UPI003A898DD0